MTIANGSLGYGAISDQQRKLAETVKRTPKRLAIAKADRQAVPEQR